MVDKVEGPVSVQAVNNTLTNTEKKYITYTQDTEIIRDDRLFSHYIYYIFITRKKNADGKIGTK